jgi:hypothetical protein
MKMLACSFAALALLSARESLADPLLGHFWAGDGIASLSSNSTHFASNRLQLGAQLQFGEANRIITGLTLIDATISGENTVQYGTISRWGTDIDIGYFILPQKLWAVYSYYLGTGTSNYDAGSVFATGQGASVGYRFYDQNQFNIAVEAAFGFIGTSVYPAARIWSLSLRFGFDLWGHRDAPS